MGHTPLKSKSSFTKTASQIVQPIRGPAESARQSHAVDLSFSAQNERGAWSALNALGACVWRLDLRSGRAHVSSESLLAFEHVFNVNPQCLTEGRFGFSAHAHPDDRDRLLAMLAARIDQSFQTHFRIIDKEGSLRWIYLKVAVGHGGFSGEQFNSDSMWFLAQNDTREKAEAERQKHLLSDRILSSLFGCTLSSLPIAELSSKHLRQKISEKWRPVVEEKGLRWIGADLAPMGPASVISASEPLLLLMMDSLFENAIEASLSLSMPDSPPWIRFEFFEDNDAIFLAISDSGPGVPLIHRGQVFEPFFSTRPEHASGLGLTLARTAAEWHKGTLRLDHYSKNTRFVAQIPKQFNQNRPQTT
jgi:hypothetical protein